MIVFSDRVKLENRYRKWLEENSRLGAKMLDCPMNFINFLQGQGLLNDGKILDFLKSGI